MISSDPYFESECLMTLKLQLWWLPQFGSYVNGTYRYLVCRKTGTTLSFVKNWRDTGVPSINENNGSSGDLWPLTSMKVCKVKKGHNKGLVIFCCRCKVVDWLECLKWGIVSSKELPSRGSFCKVTCFAYRKCCFAPAVLVISATLRKAENAKTYIAWNNVLLKAEVVIDGRADASFDKMFGVIGSLLSIAGLTLLNPCSCFLTRKFWVRSW